MNEYEIYKLEEPQLQVGMPNTHKWAVGKKQEHGVEFVDAFKTKKAAQQFIAERGGQEVFSNHKVPKLHIV